MSSTERGLAAFTELAVFVAARHWLRQGFLPAQGGWLAQGARLVSALELIIAEEARVQEERRRAYPVG